MRTNEERLDFRIAVLFEDDVLTASQRGDRGRAARHDTRAVDHVRAGVDVIRVAAVAFVLHRRAIVRRQEPEQRDLSLRHR